MTRSASNGAWYTREHDEGKEPYEDIWGRNSSRELEIEEEFLSIHGMPAYLASDIHVLFKESVTWGFLKILGKKGAWTLIKVIDDSNFDDPALMFTTLDSIFHSGSEIVKRAIAGEFRCNIGQLIEKAGRRSQ